MQYEASKKEFPIYNEPENITEKAIQQIASGNCSNRQFQTVRKNYPFKFAAEISCKTVNKCIETQVVREENIA
jgi:hypothetical protein